MGTCFCEFCILKKMQVLIFGNFMSLGFFLNQINLSVNKSKGVKKRMYNFVFYSHVSLP